MYKLSECHNRFKFTEELKRFKNKYSLIYIEILEFGYINEVYGLREGDNLLIEVINKIDKVIKSEGLEANACIYENDSIFIRVNTIDEKILDEKLNDILAKNYKHNITFKIAYVIVENLDEALNFMQNVKKVINNRKYIAKNNINIERFNLTEELNRYLFLKNDILQNKEHSFYLVYQPKVSLKTNTIEGVEVLSRWNHPKIGSIPPTEFMNIVKDLDKECDFDMYVFENACKDYNNLRKNITKFSINLSISTLKNQFLSDRISNILKKYNIDPKNITIEILESTPIEDYDILLNNINSLIDLGFKISIDDFGTGYSSYYRLCSFKVSEIKLPREFLIQIDRNIDMNFRILVGIVSLCKALGCSIVAEGIETEKDKRLMKELGVDEAQGYLFSKPLILEEFNKLFL